MTTRRSKRGQNKKARTREDLVRRSPILSIGAKLLWIELLRGWAWNDKSCNPSQPVLANALGVGKRSIIRWAAELQGHGLLTVSKTPDGNFYSLAETIPEEICHPDRLINRDLGDYLAPSECQIGTTIVPDRHQRSDNLTTPSARLAPSRCQIGTTIVPDRHQGGAKLAPKDEYDEREDERKMSTMRALSCSRGSEAGEGVHSSSLTSLAPTEPRKEGGEGGEEEEEKDENLDSAKSSRDSAKSFLDSDKKNLSSALHSVDNSTAPPQTHETEELLTEKDEKPPEKRKKRTRAPSRKRNRRSADRETCGVEGTLAQAAREATGGPEYVQATPPPPTTPADVLELLWAEVKEKYGEATSRGIDQGLGSKERGQIRKLLLDRFPPDVVMSMVRVLVWDWEVARAACFPPRRELRIPKIDQLIQYRAWLSAAITTGFDYTGDMRGVAKTYRSRYLEPGSTVPDPSDPF